MSKINELTDYKNESNIILEKLLQRCSDSLTIIDILLKNAQNYLLPHCYNLIQQSISSFKNNLDKRNNEAEVIVAKLKSSGNVDETSRRLFEENLKLLLQQWKKIWQELCVSIANETLSSPKKHDAQQLISILKNFYYIYNELTGKDLILKSPHIDKYLKAENLSQLLRELTHTALSYKNQRQAVLKGFFKDNYKRAFDYQEKLLLLNNWKQYLEKQVNSIYQLQLKNNPIKFRLMVKDLLLNSKQAYYINFYQDINFIDYAILAQLEQRYRFNLQELPKDIIKNLQQECEQALKVIETIINDLNKSNKLSIELMTSFIRLLNQNVYYKTAYAYFLACEAAMQTPSGQKIPILSTKLSDTYLTIFSASLAGIMFSVDIYSIRWFGLSQVTLNGLSDFVLMDIDNILKLSKITKIPERALISNLPLLRSFINLSIFMGINLVLYGANWDITKFLMMGYLFAASMQALFNTYLDKWMSNASPVQNATSAYPFAKATLGYAVFIVSMWVWQYLYPLLPSLFKQIPTEDELLADAKLCLEHKTVCQEHALKVMNLEKNATLPQIRKQWRAYATKNHPDKNRGMDATSRDAFYKINKAHRRLVELYSQKSSEQSHTDLPKIINQAPLRLAK